MTEKKLIMVPGPTNVPDRVMRAMMKPMIDHRGSEFKELYDSLTENVRYLFQTSNDVFVLTVSGTGGLECAIGNSINPGDKVVVPIFGLFSQRANETIIRRDGRTVELHTEWGTAPTANQVSEAIRKAKDVKALVIVYNETSTGVTVLSLIHI